MDFAQLVRQALYEMTVREGRVPSYEQLAAARNLDPDEVRAAYRVLDAAHVIVLKPGSMDVRSAPPSPRSTPFHVRPLPSADPRPTIDEAWAIFWSVGLVGDFWSL